MFTYRPLLIVLATVLFTLLAGSAATTISAPPTAVAPTKVAPIDAIGERKIVIDGDLVDWEIDPRRSVVLEAMIDSPGGSSSSTPRHAGAVRLLHDHQALYVGVRVVDPSRVRNEVEAWMADAVELFFDVRPEAPANGPKKGDAKYSDGVFQLLLVAPDAKGGAISWSQANTAQRAIGPIEVAGKNLPDGYSLEMRIPYASLGSNAARFDSPIGFCLAIDDSNIDKTTGAASYFVQYAWKPGPLYQDASCYGEAAMNVPANRLPYTRAIAPRLRQMLGRRLVVACVMLPSTTSHALDQFAIRLKWSPGSHQAVDTGPEPLPTASNNIVEYPQLGVRIVEGTLELKSLRQGRYTAEAILGNGLATLTSSFDAVSWSKQAAGPPVNHPAMLPGAVPDATLLHNGWKITPTGRSVSLPGDMPLRMFFTPDGRYLIANSAGFHNHGIYVIDPVSLRIVDKVALDRTWAGLCLASNGRDLYASGGACSAAGPKEGPRVLKNAVLHLSLENGRLKELPAIDLPAEGAGGGYIGGIASGKDGLLFVVDTQNDTLYRLAGDTPAVRASTRLPYRPYMPVVSPNGKWVAVSNWGDETVSVLNAQTLALARNVKVGNHPNDLAFAPDGSLFVANAGSNSVSVGSGEPARIVETIKTSLDPSDPVGSTPDAVAISPDGKRLYIANADNNDIAVVDISVTQESRVIGFIPTGWYPSALAVSPDGRRLFIGVGKGFKPAKNADGRYIPDTLSGAVSAVDLPDAAHLTAFTKQVRANSPWRKQWQVDKAEALRAKQAFAGIKHVLYIIRENRAYDQVFGDIPAGNGDPSLTLFGKEVTPNAHALARDYTLMDNLYCSGEVSEDGHQWCNAAYATDFTEKAWINSYGGHGEPDADERLTASPAGYLWDNCARHGLTYRSYGEFSDFTSSPGSAPIYDGPATLKGHASALFSKLRWVDRDTKCARIFINELHAAEKSGQWPNYMVMSLPEDHTFGTGTGRFTPQACVASNDQALGQIVEAVSHSRFWKQTAIFVIEDDAQDGFDHVDAHRTVGLVISPYTRRGIVDSTFYTTASMVRTMEEILRLPTMTQYDGGATPLYHAFTSTPVLTAYKNIAPLVDINERNPGGTASALKSDALDFSTFDRVDPKVLNEILWAALRPGIPEPAPVHGAVLP